MFLIDYLKLQGGIKETKPTDCSYQPDCSCDKTEVRWHRLINEAQQEISNNIDKETILA